MLNNELYIRIKEGKLKIETKVLKHHCPLSFSIPPFFSLNKVKRKNDI